MEETYFIYKQADYENREIKIMVDKVDNISDFIDNDDILDGELEGLTQAVKFGRVFVKAYETFYPDFDVRLIILN